MGIREEIEKLETYQYYDYETINKADVLSLLNEWECFGETIIKEGASPRECGKLVHDFVYGAFLSEYDKMIGPGDHIIIYVRRKNESSS